MRSLIIIEVEHGDTTDGVNEALFNMGIGSQFDPATDDQWPTGDDGESWPMLEGMDYRITDYTVRVDVPECFTLDKPDTPPGGECSRNDSCTAVSHYLDCTVWPFNK